MLVAALFLLAVGPVSAHSTACSAGMAFCVNSYIPSAAAVSASSDSAAAAARSASSTNASNTICFTVTSNVTGWVGIGMGEMHLHGSDVYLGWKNTTNGYTIANLKGTSEYVPSVNDYQNAYPVNFNASSKTRKYNSTGIQFSFCRPILLSAGVDGVNLTTTTPFIFAYSSTPPSGNIDLPNTNFDQHDEFGVFGVIDFLTPSVTTTYLTRGKNGKSILVPTSSFSYSQVVQLHATLMWLAWVVCPFVGIFVARYFKDYLGHNWFRIHVGSMVCTLFFAAGGFIVMFLYIPVSSHFLSSHAIIGLVVLILMVLQAILGYVCNIMFSPDRKGVPWYDKAHWYIGRSLFLLAIVNVQLGWYLYAALGLPFSMTILISVWAIIGAGFLLFVLAEFRVGQVTHDADHEDGNLISSSKLDDAFKKPNPVHYDQHSKKNNYPIHSPRLHRSPNHSQEELITYPRRQQSRDPNW